MLKTYRPIIATLLITAVLYCVCIVLSPRVIKICDQKQYRKFLAEQAFYTPLIHGVPAEIDVVYGKVFHLAERNNILFLGASTTRQGVIEESLKVPAGRKISNLSMAADTIDSFRLMCNYMDRVSNHRLDKTDVVILHIWYASFADTSADYLKRVVELFGGYRVEDRTEVRGSMSHLQRGWRLLNYRILSAVSRIFDGPNIGFGPNCATAGAILRTLKGISGLQAAEDSPGPVSESKLRAYEARWTKYMGDTTFPGRPTEEFLELVSNLQQRTNLIVVNLYTPTWQRSYPAEKQYERWLRSDLIPFLSKNSIPFIDFSGSIPDSEYGDSAHLFKRGRERYTDLFNSRVMSLIPAR